MSDGEIERIMKVISSEEITHDIEHEMARRELLRRIARRNHLFLLHDVLGYPKFGKMHEELLNFVENLHGSYTSGLILVPRGHLKSTVVTVGHVIGLLTRNPDLRILITNALSENSRGFLREIKTNFEKSERFRYLFGEYVSPDRKWTELQIEVAQRTKVLKEPSVQATSVDKSVVSQHYDVIIADDIVNRETISTRDQRNKSAMYVKDLFDLLEPKGTMIVIGTRWHFDDVYGRLIDRNDNGDWRVFHRTCWKDYRLKIPIFPEKFSAETLDKLRREKGSYEFSSQYLNTPVDDEMAEFRSEWITKFDYDELAQKPYDVYVSVDPALSQDNDRSDYSGFVVNAVTSSGRWHILEAYRRRVNPTSLIDEMFSLKRRYGDTLKAMGVEKTAFLVGLKPTIEMREQSENVRLNIVEVSPARRNKEDRIRALIPLFERGDIHISYRSQELEDEIRTFPRSKTDDVLDALAYQLDLITPTSHLKVPVTVESRKTMLLPILPKVRKYG